MTPLTTAQAAERLGLSTRSIRSYCQAGRINADRFGQDWLIDPNELERFARIPRKVGKPPKQK